MATTPPTGHDAVVTSPSWFDRIFRNPETGRVVIAQPPNLPLAIFLAATAVRILFHPDGTVGTALSVVSGVSLAWWAGDEVLRGESLFRRLLGAGVLIALVLGLVLR